MDTVVAEGRRTEGRGGLKTPPESDLTARETGGSIRGKGLLSLKWRRGGIFNRPGAKEKKESQFWFPINEEKCKHPYRGEKKRK